MISINLVPNIKQELLRAQRQRTMVVFAAIIIGAVTICIVVILGIIVGGQSLYSSRLNNTIKEESTELLKTPDLTDMLTIQNQLQKIDEINVEKKINSRLFDVLVATNPPEPNNISISEVTLDPANSTITISGQAANGYSALEVFTKTIKATNIVYIEDENSKEISLTDDVAIEQQGFGEDAEGRRVLTFTISFKYPDETFTGKNESVVIRGPNASQNVTDSYVRVPESLFANPAQTSEEMEN